MDYIAQSIVFALAVLGTLFKCVREENGQRVTWHGVPLPTTAGVVILVLLVGSFVVSLSNMHAKNLTGRLQANRLQDVQTQLGTLQTSETEREGDRRRQIDDLKARNETLRQNLKDVGVSLNGVGNSVNEGNRRNLGRFEDLLKRQEKLVDADQLRAENARLLDRLAVVDSFELVTVWPDIDLTGHECAAREFKGPQEQLRALETLFCDFPAPLTSIHLRLHVSLLPSVDVDLRFERSDARLPWRDLSSVHGPAGDAPMPPVHADSPERRPYGTAGEVVGLRSTRGAAAGAEDDDAVGSGFAEVPAIPPVARMDVPDVDRGCRRALCARVAEIRVDARERAGQHDGGGRCRRASDQSDIQPSDPLNKAIQYLFRSRTTSSHALGGLLADYCE